MPSEGYLFGVHTCCQFCAERCLLLTFAGWGGPPGSCDCQALDGTYLLVRGSCGSCVYTWCGIKNCDSDGIAVEVCLTITLTITATVRTLTIIADASGAIFTITGEIDSEGNPCGDMTFADTDFTGATAPGSVAVESGTCPEGERQPCCTECCDLGLLRDTGTGPVPLSNEIAPVCCAYLTCSIMGVPVTVPVGINGTWASSDPLITGALSVTSTCGRAYYLDWLDAGSPACHEHITTAKRSIVMAFSGATVEVFLDDNCCPESIQAIDGAASGFALAFGPTTVEDYFVIDYGGGDVRTYDLFICEDAPAGACCLPGDFYLGQTTQYQCEAIGDGLDLGTWTLGGTGCP